MPLDSPQTWTTADLTLHSGRYYSDPDDVPTPDEIPDQFTFTDQTDVTPESVRTSAAVTIAGLGSGVTIEFTATGGTIDKNNDGNFQASQTLGNSDTMRARHTASASNSTTVSTVVTGGGVSDTFSSTTAVETGESGAWAIVSPVAAKMAPNILFPRPHAEVTNAWARQRRAPSGIEWRYRCGVQGGSFPGYWEIVDDDGATGLEFIRQTVPEDFHTNGLQGWGTLRWASPVVGSYDIQIRYTDQDLTVVNRTFTLEVIDRENTTYFMFLDAVSGDDSTGTGAFSAPKRTIAAWYGANKNDSTHGAKQIYYFGGTYSVTDAPVLGGSFGQQLDMISSKPHVHVVIQGETATWDCENTAYIDYETQAGDLWWEGFSWINPHVTNDAAGDPLLVSRNQFIRAATNFRSAIVRNYFTGTSTPSGTAGSNPSCVMFTGGGATPPQYFMIADNTFDDCYRMNYALMYDTSDVLEEGNIIVGGPGDMGTSGGAGGFFHKAGRQSRVTVRANVGVDPDIGVPLLYFSQFTPTSTDVRDDFEVCWNNYRNVTNKTAAEGSGSVGIGQGSGSTGNHYGNFWSYRNNFTQPHITLLNIDADDRDSSNPGPFTFENDVIQHSGTYTDGFFLSGNGALVLDTNFFKTGLATGTSLVDSSTNLLTGSARTTYLETHGCEFVLAA